MKSDMTLTRRFVLYVAGIISVLLIGSLLVTSAVVRSAFTDLFSQRLSRSRQALARTTFGFSPATDMSAWTEIPQPSLVNCAIAALLDCWSSQITATRPRTTAIPVMTCTRSTIVVAFNACPFLVFARSRYGPGQQGKV